MTSDLTSNGTDRGPDVETLARDRPLVTRELHFPNAYYGHDRVLRRYSQLPSQKPLKAAIEHGPVVGGDVIWELDVETRMPMFLCAGKRRVEQYREMDGRARDARAIGPLVLYAREPDERPPGKRLLFFPAHSSHHVPASYDFQEVERTIEGFRSEWNEVSVCLYWRDALNGHADHYRSMGVECVTAGHIYDPEFLDRLRAIIERCDAVSSIEVGSHIFYSIALGRPVTLERQEVAYGEGGHIGVLGSRTPAWRDDMKRLRQGLERGLTDNEVQWVLELIGAEDHKSPAELRAIFEHAEELYRQTYGLPERIAHAGRARTPQPVRHAASWLVGRTRRD